MPRRRLAPAPAPLANRVPHSARPRGQAAGRIGRLLAAIGVGLTLLAQGAGVAATPAEAQGFTQHLAQRINDYRQAQGLAPLVWSDDLATLAAGHSQDMAERRQLSHAGFSDRRAVTRSRICVENVAHNFPTAETLLDGWRRSPGHHRNLLEPKVARMGVAATARYVTFFACL